MIDKLGVHPAQNPEVIFMVATNNYPVWPSRLGNSRTFCQKLRIGSNTEVLYAVRIHDLLQVSYRPNRHRALIDKNDPAFVFSLGNSLGNILSRSIIESKIGRTIQIGRRWQAHENGVRTLDERFQIRGKE